MGSFVDWFSRSYKGVIIGLVAFGTIMLVVLATQHVNASRPAANAAAGPIPTFSSTPDDRPLAYFLGDSYTFGYGANSPNTDLPAQVASDMKWRPDVDGVGGTGYTTPSAAGGDTYPDRADKVSRDSDYVVISGGVNDATSYTADPSKFTTAVKDTLDKAAAAAPQAKLIVVGPFWPYDEKAPSIGAMNKIVKSAADDHDAVFIDALQAGWMSDPAVADNMLPDHLHPNQKGYDALATDLVGALKQQNLD
jgi:acyl-CoA thioesterase-1